MLDQISLIILDSNRSVWIPGQAVKLSQIVHVRWVDGFPLSTNQ